MERQRLSKSRSCSFLAITAVYIIAGIVAVIIYRACSFNLWLDLLIADIAATIVIFIFSCIFRNASVYDPYWSVQPPVILTLISLGTTITAAKALLLTAVWYWGVRLTANWAYTFHGLEYQDWRYTMLHEKTGRWYPVINFLGIHLFPTLVVYACILPAVYAIQVNTRINAAAIFFFLVSITAVTLQLVADKQMHEHRRLKNKTLIRTGVWRYSRHPNYLGEILMWWAVALFVICMLPQYWYLCAGAAANTLMFLFVSIPMAEKRLSARPEFAEYKKSTRMLLPVRNNHPADTAPAGQEKIPQ